MTEIADLKRAVCAAVDEMRAELIEISRAIHAEPELAFHEEKAAARLTTAVERHGLPIARGAYGLKTAFASEFGPKDAPRVAMPTRCRSLVLAASGTVLPRDHCSRGGVRYPFGLSDRRCVAVLTLIVSKRTNRPKELQRR
jgi:hypothetical protein